MCVFHHAACNATLFSVPRKIKEIYNTTPTHTPMKSLRTRLHTLIISSHVYEYDCVGILSTYNG